MHVSFINELLIKCMEMPESVKEQA
jgi:hypothetical protein